MSTVGEEIVKLPIVILVHFIRHGKWCLGRDTGLWEESIYLDFGIYTALFFYYILLLLFLENYSLYNQQCRDFKMIKIAL